MTESTLPPEPAKDATADEIEADIAATREQLGETIDALEDKLNVSAQARRTVDRTKTQLTDKVLATKADVAERVVRTRAQVSGRVAHTKGQLDNTVAQTKAKFTPKPASAAPDASFTSTGAALKGKVRQTTTGFTQTAGRVSAHTRQHPRSVLPPVGAAAGVLAAAWLSWRRLRKPGRTRVVTTAGD